MIIVMLVLVVFSQVCLMELRQSIFSIHVYFQYCLVGSLLVH
jgi:hypothetical protein